MFVFYYYSENSPSEKSPQNHIKTTPQVKLPQGKLPQRTIPFHPHPLPRIILFSTELFFTNFREKNSTTFSYILESSETFRGIFVHFCMESENLIQKY